MGMPGRTPLARILLLAVLLSGVPAAASAAPARGAALRLGLFRGQEQLPDACGDHEDQGGGGGDQKEMPAQHRRAAPVCSAEGDYTPRT